MNIFERIFIYLSQATVLNNIQAGNAAKDIHKMIESNPTGEHSTRCLSTQKEFDASCSCNAEERAAESAPAVRDVLAERQRQVSVEGWTPEHDDKYQKKELRSAALCYMRAEDITKPGVAPGAWPWPANWWKPTTDRHNLVKAGALILAEIDRIDRAAPRTTSTPSDDSRAAGCPCPCPNVEIQNHGDGTASCIGKCPTTPSTASADGITGIELEDSCGDTDI
jgi:hypothetical protein